MLFTLPLGVWMMMADLTAPVGTVVSIAVSDTTENDAETSPNATLVAPVKPVPVIVTGVPTGPLVGENPEMVGVAAMTVVIDPSSDATTTARIVNVGSTPCRRERPMSSPLLMTATSLRTPVYEMSRPELY